MTKLASELEVPLRFCRRFSYGASENREAVIDGCKGVQEYNDERIILKLNKKTVMTFLGLNLELKAFTNERVIISGYIANIGFSD